MIRRIAAAAVLGALLPATSALAQSVAEQLQKGIYSQEAEGDLDAAIQIFRQILSSNPSQRNLAAQAQFHLFQALLQKGDLNAAQQEFQNLALNYSDYRTLIMSMAGNGRGGHGPNITKGTVQNGRYHHNVTGIEFDTPAGWTIEGDSDSSDSGEMVILGQSKSRAFAAVWMKPDPTAPADMQARLRHDLERKHEDRTDFKDWKIRAVGDVSVRSTGGWQTLNAVADYTEGSEPMVEYLIWVRSTKVRALFFGRARVADSPVLQACLQQMVATAVVP